MRRKVTIDADHRQFNIVCNPLIECRGCGEVNPPDSNFCMECGSSDLEETGLIFEDDIGFAWSGINEAFDEKPPESTAIEYVVDSLEAHAELYETLFERGWELAELSGDGNITFVRAYDGGLGANITIEDDVEPDE